MVKAPLRVGPGNFTPFSLNLSFFPPLPSARQQFIYIIVYADSFLPPPRTHNDFSWWYFPLIAGFFLVMCSPLPPLLPVATPQNTPFLGFFGVFPSHACINIFIYICKYIYKYSYMTPRRLSLH